MSARVHVQNRFHSVGHGTFYTGVAHHDGKNSPRISWIYDCGSKRPTKVNEAIGRLGTWEDWPSHPLELLALSHLDDDHVNGLADLLKRQRTRWLILPYLDLQQRLAAAASVSGESVSASTSLFQIDPATWLQRNGLSEQVDHVLLVRGGGGPEAAEGTYDLSPQPFPDSFPHDSPEPRHRGTEQIAAGPLDESEKYPLHLLRTATTPLTVATHKRSYVLTGWPLEFTFFNASVPTDRAPRSKASMDDVRRDILAATEHVGLMGTRRLQKNWRDPLRRIYDRHFGQSSAARNNISLCLFVRPLCHRISDCGWFEEPEHPAIYVDVEKDRGGVLLTGDLALSADLIAEMQSHFGPWRWASLGLTQVPHHGSRHSWFPGASGMLAPSSFVQCIPDVSKHGLHPHATVLNDLVGHMTYAANYSFDVIHQYHTA